MYDQNLVVSTKEDVWGNWESCSKFCFICHDFTAPFIIYFLLLFLLNDAENITV